MMDEDQHEEYLRHNGWFKISQNLWSQKDCTYECCLEMAVDVQKYRDEKIKEIGEI